MLSPKKIRKKIKTDIKIKSNKCFLKVLKEIRLITNKYEKNENTPSGIGCLNNMRNPREIGSSKANIKKK